MCRRAGSPSGSSSPSTSPRCSKLGAKPSLGVLITGPAGVGKATLVRAVCAGRRLVELDGPGRRRAGGQDRQQAGRQRGRDRGQRRRRAADHRHRRAAAHPTRAGGHDDSGELRKAVATPGVVFIATSQQPDALDPRLQAPDLCDRELGLSLPDAATRKALLEVLLRDVPAQDLELSGSPTAHRVSCAPTWPRWCARRHCGRRRAPVRTASRRRSPRTTSKGADGDPAVVTVGHRGGVGRLGDAGGRRRHGRHQGGADRGRVVAAAASGHLRPPGRGPAEGCAALWPAGLRQDVRGARAGQFRPVERAFRQRVPS